MLEEIEFRRQLLVSETAAGLLQKIEEYDRQAASLEEEVTKARAIHAQQVIVAPVDGTVQESSVHTLGAVVTPAQVLMHIVPRDVRLEVEAYLNNQDIGFVQARQQAEIKVHAFPFAEYGVIDARVSHISDDAIADEQRGWVYRMRLSMEKSAIRVNDKVIGLKPGMEVTAEIKTGQRHLIQYFLSPIIQYANESIRER
jgi:hemolysin D